MKDKDHKFKVGKLKEVGGRALEVNPRMVSQSNLTAECWDVQMWGLDHCEDCELKDSKECGGKEIRKTGKNKNGHSVPIN